MEGDGDWHRHDLNPSIKLSVDLFSHNDSSEINRVSRQMGLTGHFWVQNSTQCKSLLFSAVRR